MENNYVRSVRESRGISLQQFADLLGVSRLEALSIEGDDINGILDDETKQNALNVLTDPSLTIGDDVEGETFWAKANRDREPSLAEQVKMAEL